MTAEWIVFFISCSQASFNLQLTNDHLSARKDPVQDQRAAVGRLFLIPRSQPEEAGARGGGKTTHISNVQIKRWLACG